MFNTLEWCQLTNDTYGYPVQVFESNGFRIYYSHVKNEIGEYLIAPSFGDFISLNNNGLLVMKKWVAARHPIPVSLKVCCDFYPESLGLICKHSGFIHQIEYESYSKWYDEIVTQRFKRNIKKGLKNNIVIKIERTFEAMRRFWEMHAVLRQKKFFEIPQPWEYFRNIYEIFLKSEQGFIFSAYAPTGEFIAGILVIIHEDTAYYKFNVSDLSQLETRPNNILIDRLICYLDSINIKKLNLGYTGGSSSYEGLRAYKLSTGAKECDRFVLHTLSYANLDRSLIAAINNDVKALIDRNPSIDEVDRFSMKNYKYFV